MPQRMINENNEEIYFGNATPFPSEDHVLEHVGTTHTPMGSKSPVYKLVTYREVFSPALKASRLAEDKRIADAIADELRVKENARLTKNAKSKMRRHHNKTFDERVAVLSNDYKAHSMKMLRASAKGLDIDTKSLTKKAELALAIATLVISETDARQYAMTNYYTKFVKGVPQ